MEEVFIISGVRTPMGAFNESLSTVSAHKLGACVIKAALEQAKVSPAQVSEVIMGQVLTAGEGQNPARQASLAAGVPEAVPAWGLNMLCGSGLKAVILAAQSIRTQASEIVVAGGQENMSLGPHVMHLRSGVKMGNTSLVDTTVHDGLIDAFSNHHMGITAENLAKKFGVTRKEQDEQALQSQMRAKQAVENGYFKSEIVPVLVETRKGTVEVVKDEFPKPGTTLDTLSNLKPAFIRDGTGTVTAGNASGINDGAAALVLASATKVKELSLKPIARVVASSQVGVDPQIMGFGPVPAIRKALSSAGWTKDDVDLYELNEAFAAVSVACVRELGLDPNKVNVNGGAVALGHPIGSSGARVLVTLLHALKRTQGKKGVAALCIGGGMGIALCVEMV